MLRLIQNLMHIGVALHLKQLAAIEYMEKHTEEKVDSSKMIYTPFYNTEGIEVEDYIDLGT